MTPPKIHHARRTVSLLTAAALILSGLAASTAAYAATGTTEVPVDGVLRVISEEPGHQEEASVTLLTSTGAEIELDADTLDDVTTGDTFEGTVAVDGAAAAAVNRASTDTAAVDAVAEHQDGPVAVTSADITPAVAAAATAAPHSVDVMWAAPAGYPRPATAGINAMVNRLGDFWTSQSNGQVSAITRTSNVMFADITGAQLCDAQAMWDYAAGPSGFNRTGVYMGSKPQTYYYAGGTRTHLLVIVPGNACSIGTGLGTVGSVHSGGVTWSSVPDDPTSWDQVIFHEVGHNLGLGHSNLTECKLPNVEGTGCVQREYWDFYDVMGGGMMAGSVTNFHDIASLNVSQKVNLSALTRTGTTPGVRTVTKDSGPEQTFTINANGRDTGTRGLEVIHPTTGERTFVEYRHATGRDANAFYKRVNNSDYGNGVRLHRLACTLPDGGCSGAESTVLRNSTGKLFYSPGETYSAPGAVAPFTIEVVSTSATSATVTVAFDVPPVLDGPVPTIAGTPQVGVVLTAVPGTWPTGTKFTYQWYVDGAPVAGATGTKFTPRAEDIGKLVTVTVNGVLGESADTQTSAETAPVAEGVLAFTTPTISGTAKAGGTLTANPVPAKWTPRTTFTYQWLADGQEIDGATAKTLILTGDALGARITVRVTGALAGYRPATATSAQTAAVGTGTFTAPNPTITGTAKAGETLTVNPGTWTPTPELTYQWLIGGAAVPGATQVTFTPTPDHVGQAVSVKVTGTADGFTTLTKTATGPKVAGEPVAPTPEILGDPIVGATLTVNAGTWPKGTKLAYQWSVDGEDVRTGTGTKFTLAADHIGGVVTVRVTGTYDGMVTTSEASTPTRLITPATLKTNTPEIAGVPQVGTKLIAYAGTWTFATKFAYQWTADGQDIPDANGLTFTPTAAEADKQVAVRVTGTLPGYQPEEMTSESHLVAYGTLNTVTPKVTGTATVGKKLTASPVNNGAGVTHSYQWFRDGLRVTGEKASSYLLTEHDKGSVMSVAITYDKDGYEQVTFRSANTSVIK